MSARILVTGSRLLGPNWPPGSGIVATALDEAVTELGETGITVVHGQCAPHHPSTRMPIKWAYAMGCGVHPDRLLGADWQAHRQALGRRWALDPHPADWREHGRAAGPIRNRAMVDAGADICLVFLLADAENRGTKDCWRRADRAGIPVRVFEQRAAR